MKKLLLTAALLALAAPPAFAAYDKPYVGEMKRYVAKKQDTIIHLARDQALGFVEMRAANPYVDPWLPGVGTEIVLPARHLLPDADYDGVVINLPEMRLYAFVNGDDAPTTFPIGIGREGLETPTGQTRVVRKKDGPTWTPTARMRREDPDLPRVVPAGPDNPLGTHALYLGWPTYLLHGTNKPYGIGRRVSSGCIRLYPENIKELFKIIPVGTKVSVVNQPIKTAWIDDKLYMEAHPDMQQAFQMEETGQVYTSRMSNEDLQSILKAAGEHQSKLHWPVIRKAIKNRTGYPVMIARKSGAVMDEDDYELADIHLQINADEGIESDDEQDVSFGDTVASEGAAEPEPEPENEDSGRENDAEVALDKDVDEDASKPTKPATTAVPTYN